MRTIGIDLGKVNSQLSERDEQGGEVRNERFRTNQETIRALFEGQPPARILIESGTLSDWVAKLLRSLGHEVLVADPTFLPMYVDSKSKRKKTDKGDASLLSLAARNKNYRLAHERSAAEQLRKGLVDSRARQVRARTQVVNGLRSTFARHGIPVPACAPEKLGDHVKTIVERLPEDWRPTVKVELKTLKVLNDCITKMEETLEKQASSDVRIKRLMTVPGVGPVVATAFVATIDDPKRFDDGHQLASYLGLCPSETSSGERTVRGHITKAGPKALRALMVQAGWGIWRTKDPEALPLKTWAQRIHARRHSKRLAVTALARKLCGVLLAMWTNEKDFDCNWQHSMKLKAAA